MVFCACSPERILRSVGRSLHTSKAAKKANKVTKVPALSATEWIGVVGLEIHAQISSLSKLFSGSSTAYAASTNTQVSLFDCATPGTLPVLNRKCVEAGIKTALALNCKIHPVSLFDRKHYFYADLPTGYQITQHFHPIANDGWMEYSVFVDGPREAPTTFRASIEQIQLEQDSGKSLHNSAGQNSLIDLNRAGNGLMEIITRPNFSNGQEASDFVRELVLLLGRLKVCDIRLFEGSLRVDANVSVHRQGEPLGVRSEVKNVNSMKFVQRAVDFEIARQIELVKAGGTVTNETRGFDFKNGVTHSLRDKEVRQDYRYMPEPNLPPLRVFDSDAGDQIESHMIDIAALRRDLPELPFARRSRFLNELKISPRAATDIMNDDHVAELFEKSTALTKSCNLYDLAGLTTNVVYHAWKNSKFTAPEDFHLKPAHFAALADMLTEEKISRPVFIKVVNIIFGHDGEIIEPIDLITKNNWYQISDRMALEKLCDAAIAENPDRVAAVVKTKKPKAVNVLVEKVKLASNELANLRIVREIFDQKLGVLSETAGEKNNA